MFKVIETFSGIGSQSQALKNIGVNYSIEATVEWEIAALYAYDIIHNGPQNIKDYRHHTKQSIIEEISKYNISNDGKAPITSRGISAMNVAHLKAILAAIDRNNNLVDITQVTAEDIPQADLLTYSFPCQDLSVSGNWHKNQGGIDRDANNRSTLLWQIERILIDLENSNKPLPKFLLMENVSNILSAKHIKNFEEWCSFLESLGYVNQIYTLDARNFGVPQSRIRTYMISVLATNHQVVNELEDYFFINNLENYQVESSQRKSLEDYLCLDYSNELYRKEAIESTPQFTESREKIYTLNKPLAKGRNEILSDFARTVTTKQDRHPNSGIILYDENNALTSINTKYRNLTPRECFLLMGFDENSFDLLMSNNFSTGINKQMLTTSKLVKLAGNSIVVQVLEVIFQQMMDINERILKKHDRLMEESEEIVKL
ncbi:DNA (cytosine-5-)-methyltransferase [Mammaliicoccus sciuri]|uniref:Cytosine-specific methyltransferase n=1 Tax=Mammaliicoccus sciuri TaxID=1296 RepID=A0AB37HNC6_MAMSC|nr:DNA (cytosine-5-)-methyltransferase [Mammaliicoccus sciuri]QQC95073.1 DNA (cytosine-5-)-methyltransferase [Mammaliicoccus sciuri]QRN91419.1 DNA (cytosine-5-)-methyltransferase [Mammaliicoccus sciuri]